MYIELHNESDERVELRKTPGMIDERKKKALKGRPIQMPSQRAEDPTHKVSSSSIMTHHV